MKKMSIAIIDDHKMIREMWTRLFCLQGEMEVVGESGSFTEGIEMLKQVKPDIVLLDINIPPQSGLEAVPLIRKFSPGTRIIAVSMHSQPAYAKKMLRAGAKGYVTKNSPHDEIFKAIHKVMIGDIYLCAEIKDNISMQVMSEDNCGNEIHELSLREIEVIRLIKAGLSSKEIASQLNLSTHTVDVHRHNILKKLKLKNTASLISFINTTDLLID